MDYIIVPIIWIVLIVLLIAFIASNIVIVPQAKVCYRASRYLP